jgi:hypothetical protein
MTSGFARPIQSMRSIRLVHSRAEATRRFGTVLVLLLLTYLFLTTNATGPWARAATVTLQAVTLVAALAAAETRMRIRRLARSVSIVCVVAAIVATQVPNTWSRDGVALMSLLLVGVAPTAIGWSIVRRRLIDTRTVLGAICIYVLLAYFWAFVYSAIGNFSSRAFFVQETHPTAAQYLYFSLVTLTTVGYGDLTATTSLGRALAAMEALLGQVYLVTVVAVLVANLGLRPVLPAAGSHDDGRRPGPEGRS